MLKTRGLRHGRCQSNGGLADARNAGIRAARAQYILPLDGDDLILPPFLEQAMGLLRQDNSTNLVIANLKVRPRPLLPYRAESRPDPYTSPCVSRLCFSRVTQEGGL